MGPLFLSLLSALEIFILEMYVMLQHILLPLYPNPRVSPISTLSKRVLQIIDLKDPWFASLLLCIICCAYYCYLWDLCCMEIHNGLWNYSSSVLSSLTPPTFLRSIILFPPEIGNSWSLLTFSAIVTSVWAFSVWLSDVLEFAGYCEIGD